MTPKGHFEINQPYSIAEEMFISQLQIAYFPVLHFVTLQTNGLTDCVEGN